MNFGLIDGLLATLHQLQTISKKKLNIIAGDQNMDTGLLCDRCHRLSSPAVEGRGEASFTSSNPSLGFADDDEGVGISFIRRIPRLLLLLPMLASSARVDTSSRRSLPSFSSHSPIGGLVGDRGVGEGDEAHVDLSGDDPDARDTTMAEIGRMLMRMFDPEASLCVFLHLWIAKAAEIKRNQRLGDYVSSMESGSLSSDAR
ncbi:hypothetical protein ZIOFF_020848 [Zingiber officinale]|uniref:Uncharacterized protein n=1 Tax=Zingiber officinale TaxID=94328 RepID=A0A8J5L840_ZINOF|nr:hypothetical protein ZIOFF_020848 [Zingiber officinale]